MSDHKTSLPADPEGTLGGSEHGHKGDAPAVPHFAYDDEVYADVADELYANGTWRAVWSLAGTALTLQQVSSASRLSPRTCPLSSRVSYSSAAS